VFTAEVDSLGRFGLFTYDTTQAIRKMDFDQLVCQPRLFSPAGKTFEFPSTNILFNLESSNDVTARIFNIGGRLKKTIKPEFPLSIGSNVLSWDGKDENGDVVTSGLYIVTLDVNGTVLKTTVGVLNR
jgi:flagellar hook assembly protein FlgD